MQLDRIAAATPFPHAHLPDLLPQQIANATLDWFRKTAPWRLLVASFYEQYEFSLLGDPPPQGLERLTDGDFIAELASLLQAEFGERDRLDLVDIAAHKLVSGQIIRIHNDFIDTEESHRILIQLNEGWQIENGGLLMLFGSDDPEDVQVVILPRHGSCFAFEISPTSHHAVSRIHKGDRYTLVYTFKRQAQ